jgi:phosphoribosyl 1,2-cyclic phosphodiesterase
MLKIQTIASGSKGNCTYVASTNAAILVDIGLTAVELLRRLETAKIDPTQITAILVTHEHIDHVRGVMAFQKRFNTPVYIHEEARGAFCKCVGTPANLKLFTDMFTINDISVDHFNVPHDSQFCFGYTFTSGDKKVSLATDIGHIRPDMLQKMAGSQIVLLECNHDLMALEQNTKYPTHLKRRIAGSRGHLSNAAASMAIYQLAKFNVQQIILAHLSEENNTPNLAFTFVRDFLHRKGLVEGTDISIDVAAQHEIGNLFEIE